MKKLLTLLTLGLLLSQPAWAGIVTFGAVAGNWSDDTKWVLGAKPAAGDDVVFNVASGNCNVNETTASLKSLVMTGYTGTLSGSGLIEIAPATGGGTISSNISGTITWIGTLYLSPAGTTILQFTSNSKTIRGVVCAGTGTVTLMDGLATAATDTFTLTRGTLKTDGDGDNHANTHSWGLFSSSNTNTRTLTLGNSTIGITGSNASVWDCQTETNLTVNGGTSTINLGAVTADRNFYGGSGKTYGTLNITGSSSGKVTTIGFGTLTFGTLTYNGGTSKLETLTIGTNITVTGTLTINGNSITNRAIVKTNTLGTAYTLTATTVVSDNVDFRDITGAGAASWDLSAGSVGNCGGNTGITFTTAATQTATGNSANWSAATWSGRVPLPQDDVVLSLTAGQTLTADMPRLGKSISVTTAMTWALTSTTNTSYGSLTLFSGMTISSNQNYIFEGRGSFTLTCAGVTFGGTNKNVSISMVNGTLTAQDATLILYALNTTNGTFNANNFNVTLSNLDTSNSTARVITMGSGVWTFSLASGNFWNAGTSTNLTLNSNTSTMLVTDTGASNKTLQGGSQVYNNLSISGGGAGAVIVTGSNTFRNIYMNPAVPGTKTLTITPGSTQIFTGQENGFRNGSSAWTIATGGAAATFSKTVGGQVRCQNVNLTNIVATQTSKFYAGATPPSVDGTGNTKWIFSEGPRPINTGCKKAMEIGLML